MRNLPGTKNILKRDKTLTYDVEKLFYYLNP
jgi:hypothetical protein